MTSAQPFGLRLQLLNSDTERVLIIAYTVGFRSQDRTFSTGDVAAEFEKFRLPTPSNISSRLGRLRDRKLAVRRGDGRWSLTPLGKTTAEQLVGNLNPAEIQRVEVPSGAEFGHAHHQVIPPPFAPAKFAPAIARLLERYPFDTNVFCMTRFPRDNDDLADLGPAIEEIRSAVGAHGLTLHLASDRQLDDDLLGNVVAHMWACRYGIGLIEDLKGVGLNYNVLSELGGMAMTGRRTALLKDPSAPRLPTDFIGQIYKDVDLRDRNSVSIATHQWLANDLGLGKCSSCP